MTVKPGSKKGPLVEVADNGSLTVYVRERAIEGKATDAVIRTLAEHLGVPKAGWRWSQVRPRESSGSA